MIRDTGDSAWRKEKQVHRRTCRQRGHPRHPSRQISVYLPAFCRDLPQAILKALLEDYLQNCQARSGAQRQELASSRPRSQRHARRQDSCPGELRREATDRPLHLARRKSQTSCQIGESLGSEWAMPQAAMLTLNALVFVGRPAVFDCLRCGVRAAAHDMHA